MPNAIIPPGVLGVLLVLVAIELGRHSPKTDFYVVTGVVAILALMANTRIAFVIEITLGWAVIVIIGMTGSIFLKKLRSHLLSAYPILGSILRDDGDFFPIVHTLFGMVDTMDWASFYTGFS